LSWTISKRDEERKKAANKKEARGKHVLSIARHGFEAPIGARGKEEHEIHVGQIQLGSNNSG
jgi:hypothetical protein